MKVKLVLLLALGLAFGAAATGAAGAPTGSRLSCARHVSLLLWPKGYKAYPVPSFEVFRGNAPFGVNNILGYVAATKDGTLGYPASNIDPYCLAYDPFPNMTAAAPSVTVTGAVRLECTFPKAPILQIDRLAGLRKRLRVILRPGIVMADATVTTNGSKLTYAKRYCARRLPLIEPSS